MDKKKLLENKNKIIVGVLVLIIITTGLYMFSMGSVKDDDPRHICVALHNNIPEPESGFNPLTGWGCGHQNYNTLAYSTLFKTSENGTMDNDLATDYSISSDGLVWTVNIRDDVIFSDNSTLDAEDVAFSFNTAKKTHAELDLTNLENAKAVDNNTIEFHLVKPRSTFIYDLRYVGIVSKENYNNESPIGSGPYVLKQWDKGQQAIFEINNNYYGKKPYFTQITLLFPEESSWIELAKSGEADIIPIPINGLNETVDGYDKLSLPAGRAQGVSLPYVQDNGTKTKDGNAVGNNVTSDIAIRKALNIGINRSEIVEAVYSGYGAPEYTSVDSRAFGNPNAIVKDADPDEAKRILEEAGWVDSDGDGIREKNGTKASFQLYYPSDYLDRQSLSVAFSEHVKDLGIEVKLVGTDWDTIYANMYNSAALMQQTSPDPYKSVYQQYHSKPLDDNYMNPNWYNNSKVDSLLDEAMSMTDLEGSNRVWAESAFYGDGGYGPAGDAPWVWIATYKYTYFVNKDLSIDQGRPDNLGNDIFINVCEWTRN